MLVQSLCPERALAETVAALASELTLGAQPSLEDYRRADALVALGLVELEAVRLVLMRFGVRVRLELIRAEREQEESYGD